MKHTSAALHLRAIVIPAVILLLPVVAHAAGSPRNILVRATAKVKLLPSGNEDEELTEACTRAAILAWKECETFYHGRPVPPLIPEIYRVNEFERYCIVQAGCTLPLPEPGITAW